MDLEITISHIELYDRGARLVVGFRVGRCCEPYWHHRRGLYADNMLINNVSYNSPTKFTQLDICGGNLWATMLIDHPINLTLWRKQSLLLTDIFPLSQVYRLAGLAVVGLGVGVGVEVPNMFIYCYVFCYMDLFRESRTSNVSSMKFPAAKLGCY